MEPRGVIAKAIHAKLFLGGYVLRHGLFMLVPGARRRRGMARFRESFFTEGLLPVAPLLREVMPRAESCLGCDLCLVHPVPAGTISPRDLVLRIARASNRFTAAVGDLAPPEVYAAAEPLCPARIPLGAVAAAIRAQCDALAAPGSSRPTA